MSNRISFDTGVMAESDRFVRVPTALLESLLRVRLSGGEWRIVLWVMRQTFGWNRKTAAFSWYRMAAELGTNRGNVVRAGRKLLSSGILYSESGEIGLCEDYCGDALTKLPPQQAMPIGSAAKWDSKAMPGDIATDAAGHRNRCENAPLFRRAKDSRKDNLKTYKDRRARDRAGTGDPFQNGALRKEHDVASAAPPIPGKYDGLSKN